MGNMKIIQQKEQKFRNEAVINRTIGAHVLPIIFQGF